MTPRVMSINKALKLHDAELFCKPDENGCLQVYKKTVGYEAINFGDYVVHYSRIIPKSIMALTDTWTVRGNPVDWGIEPIMRKIQEMDTHNRADFLREMEKAFEKKNEDKQKEIVNKNEAFLYEHHKMFKKAFADVNTSNLEKVDKRRILDGNCK